MTLFDPSAQIADFDLLLDSNSQTTPAYETFKLLVPMLLDEAEVGQITFVPDAGIRFQGFETDFQAMDLADGFRSTLAWIADLCVAWHETGPSRSIDPQDIEGIVLIDEIDLHLHATLQRRLVPALRKALPNVQFIVSTHSPLVLSCFDRHEIVVLDRTAEGGIRQLDRQLFGMSMDHIYQWLMGTTPGSPVMDSVMEREDPSTIANLLVQSPSLNQQEAEAQAEQRKAFLERLKNGPPSAA